MVLGEPAGAAEPGEGALHDPAPRLDGEAPLALLAPDDLDPQALLGGPREQRMPGAGAIGPDQLEAGLERAQPRQQAPRPGLVGDVGGAHVLRQHEPFGVDQEVALAALHALGAIKAAHAARPGRAHASRCP